MDNQECVDLIEARPPAGVGILSLLDEECMVRRCGEGQQQRSSAANRYIVQTWGALF